MFRKHLGTIRSQGMKQILNILKPEQKICHHFVKQQFKMDFEWELI